MLLFLQLLLRVVGLEMVAAAVEVVRAFLPASAGREERELPRQWHWRRLAGGEREARWPRRRCCGGAALVARSRRAPRAHVILPCVDRTGQMYIS